MLKKRIDEIAWLEPGINLSKYENRIAEGVQYYDQASFEADYGYGQEHNNDISAAGNKIAALSSATNASAATVKEGDIVISSGASLSAIVGKANAGKVLSNNFIKATLNTKLLDKRYFLYIFNANNAIQRQKSRGMQGTTAVQRITLKTLGEMSIPVAPLSKQKKIGEIYSESIKLQNRLTHYASLIEVFTCAMLEETTKED